MKSIKLIVLLFSLFTSIYVNASDYYQAKAQLNIREGAGKNYNIIGGIKKGEKVLIDSIVSGWGRIIVDGKTKGYASMKYLTSNFKENSENVDSNNNEKESSKIWIWLIIAGIVIYKLFFSSNKSKRNYSSSRFSSRSNPTMPTIESTPRILWWCCRDCHTLVKTSRKPSSLYCSVKKSHTWYDLGELGEKTFICRNCNIQVWTTRRPTVLYCTENGSHNWNEM